MKVRGFWPQPQNQLDIYFLTVIEYWLGLAKPKIAAGAATTNFINISHNSRTYPYQAIQR